MTPQEQLCEKMRVEQSAYCLWLTAQPPEEILHHAYEYSVREDIILATEEMNLTPAQVRALLKSPAPLADVYKDFSKLETDYMSIVAQCVEDRADDLLKKEQQQNPPKVYRQSVTYAREHGELPQYHASCHLNERCRDEIDAALAQRFDGMRLGAGAVEQVVAEYGLERTKYVLAAAIQTRDGDGRISRANREWADVKYTPDAGGEPYVIPPDYMGDAVTITMDAVAAATAPEITEEMYEQLDYLEKHPEENYYENEENFSQYDQDD